jgi:hypothetical protein
MSGYVHIASRVCRLARVGKSNNALNFFKQNVKKEKLQKMQASVKNNITDDVNEM